MSQVNPVLILSYNGLPLLKNCVDSVRKQDVPTEILIVDNHSTDGTREWITDQAVFSDKNQGVSKGWNIGLKLLFEYAKKEHVLVLNQDVLLPSFFLRELLAFNVPFVTGFPVDNMLDIGPMMERPQTGLSPYPCFSAFLIRRSAWEKIGKFTEPSTPDAEDGFFAWAGDCDYHVRGHRLGVGMFKSGVPFYHDGSSTIRNASDEEKKWFAERGNKDRAYFRKLYGCIPGEEPAYSELFK